MVCSLTGVTAAACAQPRQRRRLHRRPGPLPPLPGPGRRPAPRRRLGRQRRPAALLAGLLRLVAAGDGGRGGRGPRRQQV